MLDWSEVLYDVNYIFFLETKARRPFYAIFNEKCKVNLPSNDIFIIPTFDSKNYLYKEFELFMVLFRIKLLFTLLIKY